MENKIDCKTCEGTGKVYTSCCGDDIKGTEYEDYNICPTCKEHLGGEEDCDDCGGTGKIEINIVAEAKERAINYMKLKKNYNGK
jgi:hypothetical protein